MICNNPLCSRLTFGRTHYDIYNSEHEHHVTLVLRKDLLLGRIQHQTPEFEILKKNSRTRVGHIYPFSTDLERSPYEEAVAIKGILPSIAVFIVSIHSCSSTRHVCRHQGNTSNRCTDPCKSPSVILLSSQHFACRKRNSNDQLRR